MKRDPDLEREILLAIEAYDGESDPGYATFPDIDRARIEIDYHLRILQEAHLVVAMDAETKDDRFAMMKNGKRSGPAGTNLGNRCHSGRRRAAGECDIFGEVVASPKETPHARIRDEGQRSGSHLRPPTRTPAD